MAKNKKTGNLKISYKIKPYGEKKNFKANLNEDIYEDTSVIDLFDNVFDFFEAMFNKQTLDEYIFYRNRYEDIEQIDEMAKIKVKPRNQKVREIMGNNKLVKSIKDELISNDGFFKEVLTSYLNYNYKTKKGGKN